MIEKPLHPAAGVLLLVAIAVALLVRFGTLYGLRAAIGMAALTAAVCVLAFFMYEMWTLPRDDPRWDDYAEAMEMEHDRLRFP